MSKPTLANQLARLLPPFVELGDGDTVPVGTIAAVRKAIRLAYELGVDLGYQDGIKRAQSLTSSILDEELATGVALALEPQAK